MFTECEAILVSGSPTVQPSKPRTKLPADPCLALAAFTSRGKPCCWVHYQADTKGPRAGMVEWFKRKVAK